MGRAKLLAKVGAGGLAFLAYLWVAGVHHASEVRRRKAARRAERARG